LNNNTAIAISESIITGNRGGTTSGQGGGISTNGNDALSINNCEISENVAGGQGGGLNLFDDTEVSFTENTLYDNEANKGGAMYTTGSSMNLSYNTFAGNQSNSSGGAIYFSYGLLTMSNNVLASNRSDDSGGAMYLVGTEVDSSFHNNIFSTNSAYSYGSGIYTTQASGFTVANNIFYANGGYDFRSSETEPLERNNNGVLYLQSEAAERTDDVGTVVNNLFIYNN
jgi:predicted outer membrane repeat protein/parallel beta-helix repeat protein